jgi:hypothetical protein
MIGLFKRTTAVAAPDTSALGVTALALPIADGAAIAPGCVGVAFDKGGHTRRIAQGSRAKLAPHETACCFHPGPYTVDLLPFAAAPELGLRLSFAIDAPDPRAAQQRFDLYLMSEGSAGVTLSGIGAAIEAALQRELAQGKLELPPCTSLDEWHAFRAGLNQLLYMRFGLMIDDCIPVDLGEQVDYAQLLLSRAHDPAPAAAVPTQPSAPPPTDAQALRRLFLELPCVMRGLRLVVLPQGQALFGQQQLLLQGFERASLDVGTMPALELAAPGQRLDRRQQDRRARHSVAAVAALDEAWALLASLSLADAPQLAALFDDADRIAANLTLHLAARRVAMEESGDA